MLQLPIGRLLFCFNHFSATNQLLGQLQQSRQGFAPHLGHQRELKSSAAELEGICGQIGLVVTREAMKRVLNELDAGKQVGEEWQYDLSEVMRLYNAIDQMIGCLRYEAITKVAMMLPSDKLQLFEPTNPLFGVEVQAKFPSLIYDVEESGKCLALGRSTAGAFHAIRCLEGGIIAMSRCLAIPDPTKGADRNWGAMLTKIKAALDQRWPTAAARFSGDGATFEALYGALAALQNPYRNATMHFDQIYTEEAAAHMFGMVGGLMRQIATRMDENGLPLA